MSLFVIENDIDYYFNYQVEDDKVIYGSEKINYYKTPFVFEARKYQIIGPSEMRSRITDDNFIRALNNREKEHREFERVLDYALKAANDVSLLKPSDLFSMKSFSIFFPKFNLFLEEVKELDLMISGSSVLAAYSNQEKNVFLPKDVDIYFKDSSILKQLDKIIRKIYSKDKIKILRSPYTLTYVLLDRDDKVFLSYQVVLSPAQRWEHVFAGFHSDLVCSGYLTKEQTFITSTRFDYWKENQIAYFFPDLVSPLYRDRVLSAYHKYSDRGFKCVYVEPFDEIEMTYIERSPKIDFELGNDIVPLIQNMSEKTTIGDYLYEVYSGEKMANIIETMACFRACPGCETLVFSRKKAIHMDFSDDKGCFCDDCFEKELEKLKIFEETKFPNMKALVTGGRCGLGMEVRNILSTKIKTFGTSRFPSEDLLKFDLKDSSTWSQVKNFLESGEIQVLILSASETLHFPGDDKLAKDWDGENNLDKDWTNDFKRENSGVWHKTLDEHSYEEIISPLMANIAGNATLLASFLKGVKKSRIEGSDKFFCCIVVTSYEGAFEKKTPFHPITNATKSALEQMVWTVKSQADFLDCSVLLADPVGFIQNLLWENLKAQFQLDSEHYKFFNL